MPYLSPCVKNSVRALAGRVFDQLRDGPWHPFEGSPFGPSGQHVEVSIVGVGEERREDRLVGVMGSSHRGLVIQIPDDLEMSTGLITGSSFYLFSYFPFTWWFNIRMSSPTHRC